MMMIMVFMKVDFEHSPLLVLVTNRTTLSYDKPPTIAPQNTRRNPVGRLPGAQRWPRNNGTYTRSLTQPAQINDSPTWPLLAALELAVASALRRPRRSQEARYLKLRRPPSVSRGRPTVIFSRVNTDRPATPRTSSGFPVFTRGSS